MYLFPSGLFLLFLLHAALLHCSSIHNTLHLQQVWHCSTYAHIRTGLHMIAGLRNSNMFSSYAPDQILIKYADPTLSTTRKEYQNSSRSNGKERFLHFSHLWIHPKKNIKFMFWIFSVATGILLPQLHCRSLEFMTYIAGINAT